MDSWEISKRATELWMQQQAHMVEFSMKIWGHQVESSMAPAQAIAKYITVTGDALAALSGKSWEPNDIFTIVQAMWLQTDYKKRLEELSSHMSEMSMRAGNPLIAAMDFWVAAEKYGFALINAAVMAAGSPSEVLGTLITTFKEFSPIECLERIEQAAYSMWEKADRAGAPQHALYYWMTAENEVLKRIAARQGLPDPDE